MSKLVDSVRSLIPKLLLRKWSDELFKHVTYEDHWPDTEILKTTYLYLTALQKYPFNHILPSARRQKSTALFSTPAMCLTRGLATFFFVMFNFVMNGDTKTNISSPEAPGYINVESPLALPSALLPPIADSTTRILGLVSRHCGDTDPDVDIIKNMVLESHKDIDQWARQEINLRDQQIEEERRLAENKKLEVSEQDVQIHKLKDKELALTNKLETCQTQLLWQPEKKNIAAQFALTWLGTLTFCPAGICSVHGASVE
ncbi:hypothetical protein F5877DRAFT_73421 [Lentinula edodes]|nr:hypothetical protein F5877DRAFT_73421 [Lentinula edodes]